MFIIVLLFILLFYSKKQFYFLNFDKELKKTTPGVGVVFL